MSQQQVQNPAGVARIVFGARGYERLAVRGGHRCGHGEQDQVRVGEKQVHNRSSLLFQGDGDGLAVEAAVQIGGPDRDRLWSVVDPALIAFAAIGGLENPSMFLAAPIQGDESGPNGLRGGAYRISHKPTLLRRGWLGSGESLIVESRTGKLLRIRFWNQAHPAARTAPRRHRTAGRRNS